MIINTGWRKQRKEDRKMHHRLAKSRGLERRLVWPAEHVPWKKGVVPFAGICFRFFVLFFVSCLFVCLLFPLTSVIFENDVSWSLHILQTRMRMTRATVTRPAVSAGLLLVSPWQWLLLCVHHWCDGASVDIGPTGPAVTTQPSRPKLNLLVMS